jgi:four helix bundle protein
MAGVKRFEDLMAWQKARELTKAIYLATKQDDFARDYGLASQIQRAAVSIMSNIAEGFERGSNSELHRFLFIAKASCAEVRSQLYIALDIRYISADEFQNLQAKAQEVARLVGGLRASIERKLNP